MNVSVYVVQIGRCYCCNRRDVRGRRERQENMRQTFEDRLCRNDFLPPFLSQTLPLVQ